jgi:hypothetical protein
MSREVVLELLYELAARLRTRGISAGIRLVRGVALAIAYYDRRATFDTDAVFSPTEPVLDVVAELAVARNLPADSGVRCRDKFRLATEGHSRFTDLLRNALGDATPYGAAPFMAAL